VRKLLRSTDLTPEHHQRIRQIVEESAVSFGKILNAMREDNVSGELYDAAKTIEQAWLMLSLAAGNNVRSTMGVLSVD
jgi:hypothetical protein